jgi:predicted NUDIX family phosphoesterase
MGVFLRSAYEVLKAEARPLTAQQITEAAVNRGLLRTSGQTPSQTMKAKLSVEILRNGTDSLFKRSDKGRFALREWIDVAEHVADRYQKALFDEDIVVFPADVRPTYVPRIGLNSGSLDSEGLLAECYPMRRRSAEEDTSVIQLISVFVVKHSGRILTYKRSKRLPETRLHGFYSVGFGGHLNPDDVLHMFNIFDPEQSQAWLIRELHEELRLKEDSNKILGLTYAGLLYDNSEAVSRQHLGIVFDVTLETDAYAIGERGFLMDSKFESLEQIRNRISEFENWSVLLVDHEGAA